MLLVDDDANDANNADDADDVNDVNDVNDANNADDAKANDDRSRKRKGHVSTLASIESSGSWCDAPSHH
jgi:hypothetical protein